MTAPTLRDRQTALARRAILDALVRHLEAGDADVVAMEDLAGEAGVSRRTLYRYFPTRAELLVAAADWIRDEVLRLPVEIGDEGIAESFRRAAARLEKRPELARALLRTRTGRAIRRGYRSARVDALGRALRRELPGLSPREVKRAAPVFAHLCSSDAWISIQDESGLSAADAQAAVAWAIDTLLARLRGGRPATTRKGGRS
jgi:AcrR family transcriptional regulator